MVRRHIILYASSRGLAAAINLISLAAFARLGGPEVYGSYLLIMAWAAVIVGFTVQWAGSTFFATYREERAAEQVASLAWLVLAVVSVSIAVPAAVGLAVGADRSFLAALAVMVAGLAISDAAVEVTRTRLSAALTAGCLLLRAVAMLGLGVAALKLYGTGTALALAIGAANLIAALPAIVALAPLLKRRPVPGTVLEFAHYGWPLLLAFGVASFGQNVDRVLLASWGSTAALGPYGAVSDLMRQSFSVIGQTVALAFVSIARRAAAEGDHGRAGEVLATAYVSLVAVVAFGGAFFLMVGEPVFALVLGRPFAAAASPYFPILLAATACMVLRSYYFGQVIYFAADSRLELWVSILTAVLAAVLSLLLIPRFQATGAALALLGGQAAACLALAVAGPRHYRLPMPLKPTLAIVALAAGALAASAALGAVMPSRLAADVIGLSLLAAAGLFAVARFNVFGLRG